MIWPLAATIFVKTATVGKITWLSADAVVFIERPDSDPPKFRAGIQTYLHVGDNVTLTSGQGLKAWAGGQSVKVESGSVTAWDESGNKNSFKGTSFRVTDLARTESSKTVEVLLGRMESFGANGLDGYSYRGGAADGIKQIVTQATNAEAAYRSSGHQSFARLDTPSFGEAVLTSTLTLSRSERIKLPLLLFTARDTYKTPVAMSPARGASVPHCVRVAVPDKAEGWVVITDNSGKNGIVCYLASAKDRETIGEEMASLDLVANRFNEDQMRIALMQACVDASKATGAKNFVAECMPAAFASEFADVTVDQSLGFNLKWPSVDSGAVNLAYIWSTSDASDTDFSTGSWFQDRTKQDAKALYYGAARLPYPLWEDDPSHAQVRGYVRTIAPAFESTYELRRPPDRGQALKWYELTDLTNPASQQWGVQTGYQTVAPTVSDPAGWGRIGIWWNPADIRGWGTVSLDIFKKPGTAANIPSDHWDNGMWMFDGGIAGFRFGGADLTVFATKGNAIFLGFENNDESDADMIRRLNEAVATEFARKSVLAARDLPTWAHSGEKSYVLSPEGDAALRSGGLGKFALTGSVDEVGISRNQSGEIDYVFSVSITVTEAKSGHVVSVCKSKIVRAGPNEADQALDEDQTIVDAVIDLLGQVERVVGSDRGISPVP